MRFIKLLQYYAGHATAIGGLAAALAFALQKQWHDAGTALLAALAGFGITFDRPASGPPDPP